MTDNRPPRTAVVLAGQRPGGDRLANAHGLARKAMVPVAGRPMLEHVLDVLAASPAIDRVLVAAQDSAGLCDEMGAAGHPADGAVVWVDAADSIAATIDALLAGPARDGALVTTADNVLLTPDMLDDFLSRSGGGDLAIAMVERAVLLSAYPQSRRSWLHFRGGSWSGANLFWIGGAQVAPLINLWRGVEQDRKKGWRVISAFGPLLLIGALLRLVTLRDAVRRIGARYGLDARLVAMAQAEACIDVDKPDDVRLAETILKARNG